MGALNYVLYISPLIDGPSNTFLDSRIQLVQQVFHLVDMSITTARYTPAMRDTHSFMPASLPIRYLTLT